MTATAKEINSSLIGFTDVVEICLAADLASGAYQLRLVLADSDGRSILLACGDVSSLSLSQFGGGLRQFMCLRAEDAGSRQLDRVLLRFSDLENHAIAFDCFSARVEVVGP